MKCPKKPCDYKSNSEDILHEHVKTVHEKKDVEAEKTEEKVSEPEVKAPEPEVKVPEPEVKVPEPEVEGSEPEVVVSEPGQVDRALTDSVTEQENEFSEPEVTVSEPEVKISETEVKVSEPEVIKASELNDSVLYASPPPLNYEFEYKDLTGPYKNFDLTDLFESLEVQDSEQDIEDPAPALDTVSFQDF